MKENIPFPLTEGSLSRGAGSLGLPVIVPTSRSFYAANGTTALRLSGEKRDTCSMSRGATIDPGPRLS
jgi:hypothetical protein